MALPAQVSVMTMTAEEFLASSVSDVKAKLVTVMVVPADAPVRWLHEADTLDGGRVVPGFTCAVADIFEGIARDAAG